VVSSKIELKKKTKEPAVLARWVFLFTASNKNSMPLTLITRSPSLKLNPHDLVLLLHRASLQVPFTQQMHRINDTD